MTHATPVPENRHDTLTSVTGRSGRGTARQTIRVDEALWEEFADATTRAGADRSTVLRAFIAWYVHKPGAKPLKRPERATTSAAGEPQADEQQPSSE